jgi:hypothetical protein
MKLLHFDQKNNKIMVNTYSPYLDHYNYYDPKEFPEKDERNINVDLQPQQKRVATDYFAVNIYTTTQIDKTVNAKSGSIAQVEWKNLTENQPYSWYVVAEDDYTGKTVSDIWSFTKGIKTRPTPTPDPVPTPGAPVVNPVKVNSKNITGKAEAGAKVIVKAGSRVLGTATADLNGSFSIMLESLLKAGTVLTVTAEKEGKVSPETKVTVLDVTPPEVPVANVVKDNSKNVTGKAEAGAKVTVKAGTIVLGTSIADSKGNFSIILKSLPKAGSILTVTATDQAVNGSKAIEVTVKDGTPPSKPVVKDIRGNDKKITGKAEVGSKVTVKAGSRVIGTAIADVKGTFAITLKSPLKAGSVVTVVAKDKAGNESSVTKAIVKK